MGNSAKWDGHSGNAMGGIYGLAFIGALVYYLKAATGFWMGIWGICKAVVWPAFLIYELMQYLNM